MNRKIFILDTSAILSLVQNVTTFREKDFPGFAGVLEDNEIVIPRIVLEEIRTLSKDSGSDKGLVASDAARQLEHYSNQGSLLKGVETEKGGLLRISSKPSFEKMRAWGLKDSITHHQIIATAIEIEDSLPFVDEEDYEENTDIRKNHKDSPVVLISQDRILRVLARSVYGLQSEELKSVWATESVYERGYIKVQLSTEEIDEIMEKGEYVVDGNPFVNGVYHLVDKSNPDVHYCYAIVKSAEDKKALVIDRTKVDYLKVAGEVSGRNVRQKLLLWMLMGCGEPDPMSKDSISLVTISGPAGTGKSFLTLAAAWERLERGHFDRIIITRAMVDVGRSMGFLPGTLEEKVKPWGGPIEDNLRAIVQVPSPDEGREHMQKRGVSRSVRPFDAKAWLEMENRLEVVPLTYIRGRTFRKSFVILEEAQNLERGPLKVLLTRLGEGSLVVVLGDRSQIDNQFLSQKNNGLVHAVNAFRNWPKSVHMHLKEIERSEMAEAADKLL